jgi:predicted peptidase
VGWAARIRADRTHYPVIVLFPQAAVGFSWIDREMADLFDAQLEKTVAEFNGDPDRIYLTGFSMGGSGVYRMTYRWPERFAGPHRDRGAGGGCVTPCSATILSGFRGETTVRHRGS